jgi:pimeloyl-ACP methyl ester carboxylesterase
VTTFAGTDGTRLAYHQAGNGARLVCLPGGPMQSAAYLGDLGGLAAHRELIRLDPRGTGDSAVPGDAATYRCDRQVDDVAALRAELGLERLDLLGHSAGGSLAVLYAARYPERTGRLVLVTPSPRVVGVEITDADRRKVAGLRGEEPWFPAAFAAFERIWSGNAAAADWAAIAPFMSGRWDEAARAMHARTAAGQNTDAARGYYSDGALDPQPTRAALAHLRLPVLLIAGGYDVSLPPERAAEYANLFPLGELAVLAGGGHYPWLDNPDWFVRTLTGFLA